MSLETVLYLCVSYDVMTIGLETFEFNVSNTEDRGAALYEVSGRALMLV